MSFFKRTPVDWELIDKTVLPSGREQGSIKASHATEDFMRDFFCKTVIYTFKDRLSGKIKQTSFTSLGSGERKL
jgi:hypothetical protein